MAGKKKISAVPAIKEMEDWVLIALQELGGEEKFSRIDSKVKELLESAGVPKRETSRRIKHNRGTSLNLKTSGCRTALEQNSLLSKPTNGRWRLTASGETRANFVRGELGLGESKAPVVNNLAREARIKPDALQVLRDNDVSEEVLERFLELLVAAPPVLVEPDAPTPSPNLAVEKAAIKFIRRIEKGWHTTRTNNPGFDLFQTDSGRKNGKITVWCEVKSLSGRFDQNHPVSLTPTELEKAQECGDAYWIYIVEEAQSANPKLLKIQNPAGKTKQRPNGKALRFSYGHRWRSVAEK